MEKIEIGKAELEVLKKVVSAASSGSLLQLNAKEKKTMLTLHRRLTIFDLVE